MELIGKFLLAKLSLHWAVVNVSMAAHLRPIVLPMLVIENMAFKQKLGVGRKNSYFATVIYVVTALRCSQ